VYSTVNEYNSFSFAFELGNERDAIDNTEKQLRYLLNTVMTGKHDPSWLSNPKLGVNDYNEPSRRQQDDTKLPRDPAESVNLIDYCYIHELKEIIEKN
jgi:hypothetical protein